MSMFYVITGPPCSGKSTRAKELAATMHSPVILDLDLIRQALGSPVEHGHSIHFLRMAIRAREAVVTEWRITPARPPLFYICCTPSHQDFRLFPANVVRVQLPTTREVCHERATLTNRPDDTHQRIDEWFQRNPVRS